MSGPWFWCLEHGRVEEAMGCRAENRLGPYDTPEEAAAYADKVAERNKAWDDEDERWDGPR